MDLSYLQRTSFSQTQSKRNADRTAKREYLRLSLAYSLTGANRRRQLETEETCDPPAKV